MKEIIQKIVKERDNYKSHLDECLDLLVELDKRYNLNDTDSEYIQELTERESKKEEEVEVDVEEKIYDYITKLSKEIGVSRDEIASKIVEYEITRHH